MIELKNVSLILNKKQILDNLSFRVDRGQIVVLAGNSGEGKSTILKLILGLIRPTSGTIHVLGKNIPDLSESELMKVRQKGAIVFQEGALFDSMTVEENVCFFLKEALHVERNEAQQRVTDILRHLGLGKFMHYYPSHLSGGMKKRVAIARAIVTHPKILLYDEPTAGLDAQSALRVVELIKDLQERLNVTSLIVSHELHYFMNVMDKILYLEKGRIVSETKNSTELSSKFNWDFLNYFSPGVAPSYGTV